MLFGSLGVATKGIFEVAQTNALSVTLLRAAIALPALAAMCAFVQGKADVPDRGRRPAPHGSSPA